MLPGMKAAKRPKACPRVVAALNRILESDTFDKAALIALATRHEYPDAAWILANDVGRRDTTDGLLIPTILDSTPQIAPNRLAIAIGAYDLTCSAVVTVETLRKSKSSNALVVLALLGELPDWREATRRLRAAYALPLLVSAFRSRG